MWNLWLMLSIFFGIMTIVMLVLALTINPIIWIGFAGTLIATILSIYRYFVTKNKSSPLSSESSLERY